MVILCLTILILKASRIRVNIVNVENGLNEREHHYCKECSVCVNENDKAKTDRLK